MIARIIAPAFGLLAAVAGSCMAAQSAAVELLPHQVIYRMSLGTVSDASDITGANGAMLYKFTEGCDAWTAETNVYLRLDYSDGGGMETTWSFVSWEAKDGLSYRFRIRHNRNGKQVEALQGTASIPSKGRAGVARYTVPKGTKIELPPKTIFPTRHLMMLLDEGNRGSRLARTVFDGASLENPYEISAIIGDLAVAGPSDQSALQDGRQPPVRHVGMAFFPYGSRLATPEFELGIDYRDDGVAQWIHQDFGDFSLELSPNNFEILDRPVCQ